MSDVQPSAVDTSLSMLLSSIQGTVMMHVQSELNDLMSDMKSNLEEHLAKAAAEQVRKVIGETVKKSVRDELKGMNVGKGGGVDVDEVEAKVRDALGPMEKEVCRVKEEVRGMKDELYGRVGEIEKRLIADLLIEAQEELELELELDEEESELEDEEGEPSEPVVEPVAVPERKPEPEPKPDPKPEPEPEPSVDKVVVEEPVEEAVKEEPIKEVVPVKEEPEKEAVVEPVEKPANEEPIKEEPTEEQPAKEERAKEEPSVEPASEPTVEEEKKEETIVKKQEDPIVEKEANPSPSPSPTAPPPSKSKISPNVLEKIRKWARSVCEEKEVAKGRGRTVSMFRKAALVKHRMHKQSILAASKNPSRVSLALLPQKKDVMSKNHYLELENKLEGFIKDTTGRLDKLEGAVFGGGGGVSLVSSLGARIDKLEGALDGEIRGRVRGVEDGVGKIKVAVVKLTKSVQEGEGNREGTIGEEEMAKVISSMESKIKELKEGIVNQVKEKADRVGGEVDKLRTEVEEEHDHMHKMIGKLSDSAKPTHTVSSMVSSVLTAYKHMGKSLSLLEKKLGSINLFDGEEGTALWKDLVSLGKSSATVAKDLGEVPAGSLASSMEAAGFGEGRVAVRRIGSVAVMLLRVLRKAEDPGYVKDVLSRLSYKKPPKGVKAQNCRVGLEKTMVAAARLLGAVGGGLGEVTVEVMGLREEVGTKLGKEQAEGMYTPLEYTHNLQDTLSNKIAAAHSEVTGFEDTINSMAASMKGDRDAMQLISLLKMNLDEVKIRFMRLQDEVGDKADSREMVELMNDMGDTLRSKLSKTPQLARLTSIVNKKADRSQIFELEEEIQSKVTSNLPPALTYSTCLTCNRPLGKSSSSSSINHTSYLGNEVSSGDWKAPPATSSDREVKVLNGNTKISLTKKLNDPHSSPTLVGNLIGDPRKQRGVGKSNLKFDIGGGDGKVSVGGGTKGVVVSKYPGRMLPAVKK